MLLRIELYNGQTRKRRGTGKEKQEKEKWSKSLSLYTNVF